jgi:8-oxo-dGTP diphosphatase
MIGRGIILFIVSRVLIIILYPTGFIISCVRVFTRGRFKALDNYLFNCALADDQHGNAFLAELFNMILLKRNAYIKYPFGNTDVTISFIIAVNQKVNALNKFGLLLYRFLEWKDKDHAKKSIQSERNKAENTISIINLLCQTKENII